MHLTVTLAFVLYLQGNNLIFIIWIVIKEVNTKQYFARRLEYYMEMEIYGMLGAK